MGQYVGVWVSEFIKTWVVSVFLCVTCVIKRYMIPNVSKMIPLLFSWNPADIHMRSSWDKF